MRNGAAMNRHVPAPERAKLGEIEQLEHVDAVIAQERLVGVQRVRCRQAAGSGSIALLSMPTSTGSRAASQSVGRWRQAGLTFFEALVGGEVQREPTRVQQYRVAGLDAPYRSPRGHVPDRPRR